MKVKVKVKVKVKYIVYIACEFTDQRVMQKKEGGSEEKSR